MLVYELIKRKRDGLELAPEHLQRLIREYTAGELSDYQMAALLMAIYFRGMTTEELAAWTRAMVHSGEKLSFTGAGPYLDKHSTGGVGDKVSLPLAPVLACLGIHVPMISGRGLGHTGGTLDKLESIPGYRTDLDVPTFMRLVDEVGCSIIGQTGSLAPADKKLYALRDVTATVDSIPLIASSILSKKVASGISGLLMDVKTGSGAFMREREGARELASTLVSLGGALGLSVRAFITDMNQVLGRLAGNALEVRESIEVLRNEGPADVTELVVRFAGAMAVMAGRAADEEEGLRQAKAILDDGRGAEQFARMIDAQGGDARVVTDPDLLPKAPATTSYLASRSGVLAAVDVEKVGQAIVALGGGRRRIEDRVDPAVGLEVHVRLGEAVTPATPLATIHYRDEGSLAEARALLDRAHSILDGPVEAPPLILETL